MPNPDPESAQKVTYNEHEYSIVKEGLAEILEPPKKDKSDSGKTQSASSVFYNPIQQFNRDLSVLAIRVFAEDHALLRKQKQQERSHGPIQNSKKRKRLEEDNDESTERAWKSRLARSNDPNGNTASERPVSEKEPSAQEGAEHQATHEDGSALLTEPGEQGADPPIAPKAFSKPPFRILDALSATGLRALRYSKEIDQVTLVTANDLSSTAVEAIKLHVRHNSLQGKIYPIVGDALSHMYSIASDVLQPNGSRGKYHVVDLDPYGTAAPFLDAAVQAVQDGGMLCVTCTDSAIFASHGYVEKTFSQYGGLPIKGVHSHEGGLRLVLHAIATSAARYGLAIEPLLSLSIDFYVRVFVRVRKSASEVKMLPGKIVEVFGCDHGCGAWSIQPLARTQTLDNAKGETIYKFTASQAPISDTNCPHCGFKTHMAGPMWGGPLHNPFFIQRMLDILPSLDKAIYGTIPRMEGMLSLARDETLLPETLVKAEAVLANGELTQSAPLESPIARLPASLRDPHPFFVIPSALSKVLHCVAPPLAAFRSALIKLDYRVTRSHAKGGSLRTDAPWDVVWEVMREWVRQKAPYTKGGPRVGTPGYGVMRNDRSKRDIVAIRDELKTIASKGEDIASVRKELQSLLWRMDHGKREEPTAVKGEAFESKVTDVAAWDKPKPDEAATTAPSQLDIVFDEALGKEHEGKKMIRYQINPRRDWGPQTRARG